ncbi:MAG: DEAD/DEAH box helicase [Thermoplasmata archaeon]
MNIDELKNILGIQKLYPPQEEAIKKIMDGKNVVISMPTASGKTFIAYAGILRAMNLNMKAVYLVPLRSIAYEKYDELKKIFVDKKISLSIGDYDSNDKEVKDSDIVIGVYEKLDAILRQDPDFIYQIGVLITDEIHLMQDYERGSTIEIILTKFKFYKVSIQIIALSATISNYEDLANWLNADIVFSTFRPIPLKIGVYSKNILKFDDGSVEYIKEDNLRIGNLILRSLEKGGQVLVFVNSRKQAEKLAEELKEHVKKYARELNLKYEGGEEKNLYNEKINNLINYGVSFHHAGLSNEQRKFIEDLFRKRKLLCLVATPTLAAGVNLPARTVIVRDIYRYTEDGMVLLPSFEIKQMLGRAGRPGLDPYGEGIVLSRRGDFDLDYLNSVENIYSNLNDEKNLRMHILGLISSGLCKDNECIKKFFDNSFLVFMNKIDLSEKLDEIIEFLLEEGLIEKRKYLRATKFGNAVSNMYIDPLTGILFRDSLSENFNENCILYYISIVPEMVKIKYNDNLDYPSYYCRGDYDLDAYATSLLLYDWINEKDIDELIEKYDVGPGDIYSRIEIADWLLNSYERIGEIFKYKYNKEIMKLRFRIRYGIREELIEIVSVPNIGRIRGRRLFNMGYKSLKDLANSDVNKLSSIPGIGKKLAEEIIEYAKSKLNAKEFSS